MTINLSEGNAGIIIFSFFALMILIILKILIKKPLFIIKEQGEAWSRYKIIDISVEVKRLIFRLSGINFFNKNGYFKKLIANFKDQDKVCYLIFSRNTSFYNKNDISKALSLASSSSTIYHASPRREGRSEMSGIEICYLMIKDIESIQEIVKLVYDSYSVSYFIFDTELNKDIIYARIKDFKNLEENEKDIVSLSSDAIKLAMECCSAEEEFKIFSNRYSYKEIKTKVLDSMGKRKSRFKVVAE